MNISMRCGPEVFGRDSGANDLCHQDLPDPMLGSQKSPPKLSGVAESRSREFSGSWM